MILSIFIVAPHVDRHFIDGAGYRSFSIARFLEANSITCFLLGRCFLKFSSGSFSQKILQFPRIHNKTFFGFLSLLLNRHYIQTKHIGIFHRFSCLLAFLFFRSINTSQGSALFFIPFFVQWLFLGGHLLTFDVVVLFVIYYKLAVYY